MSKANPTDAKTVAFHFLDMTTDGRNTPATIAKTIKQVKSLLETGYTKDEIIATIDHVVKKGIVMYSFGYINLCIQDILRELKKHEVDESVEKVKQEMAELEKKAMEEVNVSVESTERNRAKLARFQSGKREQHYSDLFEGQRQDT